MEKIKTQHNAITTDQLNIAQMFGKLFEYFILSEIKEFLEDKEILLDSRFGFTSPHELRDVCD